MRKQSHFVFDQSAPCTWCRLIDFCVSHLIRREVSHFVFDQPAPCRRTNLSKMVHLPPIELGAPKFDHFVHVDKIYKKKNH